VWQNGGGIFYLTLPGSTFEKLLSKLLLTSVGYAVGSAVFMACVGAVSDGLNFLIFGVGHGFADPAGQLLTALKASLGYIIAQSVFLLGSIWFQKQAFIKTILWIMIFGVGITIVAAIAARIGLSGHLTTGVHGWSFNLSESQLMTTFGPGTRGEAVGNAYLIVAKVLCVLLAPTCWLATYYRLSEAEV
jgi:hypothetical protein